MGREQLPHAASVFKMADSEGAKKYSPPRETTKSGRGMMNGWRAKLDEYIPVGMEKDLVRLSGSKPVADLLWPLLAPMMASIPVPALRKLRSK
jgi:hypothetical protein